MHKDYVEKTNYFDQQMDSYKRNENERKLKRQAHEAFLEAVIMFEHQIKLQEQYTETAEPHEAKSLIENSEMLKTRLKALNKSKMHLEKDLSEQKQTILSLERDINCIKPIKLDVSKLREKYQL